MMNRRTFMLTLGALLSPSGVASPEPPKTARVGILASSTKANFAPSVKAFRDALKDAGWVEGRNLVLDIRYGGEQYVKLAEMATELVRLRPDVIAALGTPATQAVKRATTVIPIVMESLSDAVSTGLVANLTHPGGNVTGVSGFAPALNGKRLQLIREILPAVNRVGVLTNRANAATEPIIRATQSAAEQMRLQLQVVDVRQPTQLSAAFDTMVRQSAGALVLAAGPL